MVAVDGRDAWYSGDLIRNDTLLEERPLIVSMFGLTPPAMFFFQAEDGIRVTSVTEVQTCALPISAWQRYFEIDTSHRQPYQKQGNGPLQSLDECRAGRKRQKHTNAQYRDQGMARHFDGQTARSEERRVGKEGK